MSDQRASVSVEKPFQFSLRQLLMVMAVATIPIALISQLGAPGIALCLLLVCVVTMSYGAYWGNAWFVAGALGSSIVVCGCLLPVVDGGSRWPARRSSCQNNLRQLGIALHIYHDTYGSFPPAYIADANGRPMHSWRVLLLPFLEQENLYKQYRFDEPWDGPNNGLLAKMYPEMHPYRCPSDPDTDPPSGMTSYLAVVGPETVWPGAKAISLAKIKDGASNTLLVVESHNTGIHWMEPRDLHTTQMPMQVNPTQGQGICSCHGAYQDQGRGTMAQFVRCDGSVSALDNDTPPATLRALLTIAGGEEVDFP
jgi:hypothetical protein